MKRKAVRIRCHPGEILKHEFLIPLNMSATALANALGVPPNRITEIIAERRGMTADTAIRLARYFGTSVELWLNLQQGHDRTKAEAENDYSHIKKRDMDQEAA